MTIKQKYAALEADRREVIAKVDEGYVKHNFTEDRAKLAKELLARKDDPKAFKEFLIAFPSPEDREVLFIAFVPNARNDIVGFGWETLKKILSENVDDKQPKIFTPGWRKNEVEIAELAERLMDAKKL